ncbi:MAG TPA: hypothetical protein VHL09_07310 [Dehalococcoidia bacterium]|nr:hypothetical protein [Dehalococcoidia bacterium]
MGKGRKADSKDSASKHSMNAPSGGPSNKEELAIHKPRPPQMSDKSQVGQFTGEGQPARMKK